MEWNSDVRRVLKWRIALSYRALGWALQDSNLRPQPCESVHIRLTGRRDTTLDHLTRNNDHMRRRETTTHDAICGALYEAR